MLTRLSMYSWTRICVYIIILSKFWCKMQSILPFQVMRRGNRKPWAVALWMLVNLKSLSFAFLIPMFLSFALPLFAFFLTLLFSLFSFCFWIILISVLIIPLFPHPRELSNLYDGTTLGLFSFPNCAWCMRVVPLPQSVCSVVYLYCLPGVCIILL